MREVTTSATRNWGLKYTQEVGKRKTLRNTGEPNQGKQDMGSKRFHKAHKMRDWQYKTGSSTTPETET